LLLAWGLARWLNISPLDQLRPTGGGLVWGIIATAPLVLALRWMLTSSLPPIRRLVALVIAQLGRLVALSSVPGLAALATIAAISEETLFRGVIQVALTESFSPTGSLFVTSLLFGLVHCASRAYVGFAVLMGLYLGTLFVLMENLLAPIITHALYDFVALLYLAQRYRRGPGESSFTP